MDIFDFLGEYFVGYFVNGADGVRERLTTWNLSRKAWRAQRFASFQEEGGN
jgi:hypothetical protein